MKIAVVSDTHGNVANFKKMIDWLNEKGIKMIFHCGDISSPQDLKEVMVDFRGEFFGVFGNAEKDFNMPDEYKKISKAKIKEDTWEIELDKKKIAITHFPDTAKKLAQSGKYNVVFYGHTHRPWDELVLNKTGDRKCHMINPGELAGQFYKSAFAIYDTKTGELGLKILEKL